MLREIVFGVIYGVMGGVRGYGFFEVECVYVFFMVLLYFVEIYDLGVYFVKIGNGVEVVIFV